jgi:hypothetical protein
MGRTKHDRRVVIAAAALAALAARPAAAQGGDTARARQLFEQGVSAMEGGNPAAATSYFEQSYGLYPRASTACNLALALERTGRPCDAQRWYRECASRDQEGRFREHATRQASALGARCSRSQPTHDPFASGPSSPGSASPRPASSGGGGVQVVGSTAPSPPTDAGPGPDHTLLGVGLGALALSVGTFVGGWAAAEQSWAYHAMIDSPPGTLTAGTPQADAYEDARTFRTLAIALYVGGGALALASAVLVVVDLAQPGVLGGRASRGDGPRLTFAPLPGGARGALRVAF